VTNARTAVSVENVSKMFRLYHERPQTLKERVIHRRRAHYEPLWALHGVTFEIERGCTYGLIGPNGSGKSTLLKLMAGIHQPTRGTVSTEGRIGALLELGAGFHPELTGRENVYLNGSIMGLRRSEIRRSLPDIVEFSGIGSFIDSPVKVYSSGMYLRLAVSVAVNVRPEILIIDEVLAVGDEEFHRRCMDHLFKLRGEGITIVLVSHSLRTVQTLCDEVTWLDRGQMLGSGRAADVVERYLQQVNEKEAERVQQEDKSSEPESGLRYGSGEIRITGIALLDLQGEPLATATTGGSLVIRIFYEASEERRGCVFGLGVSHADGVMLAETNHRSFGGFSVDIARGAGYVDYVIHDLSFVPGTYFLSPSVYDRTFLHCYDERDRAFRLLVQAERAFERWGYVEMRGAWRRPVAGEAPGRGSGDGASALPYRDPTQVSAKGGAP
jgi:lipopolysaccharide transport system ATP-binding protein